MLAAEALSSCDVLLALIGPRWLNAQAAQGRRIDDAADFVRLEIATALAGSITVVPVLLGGAAIPRPADLPFEPVAAAR